MYKVWFLYCWSKFNLLCHTFRNTHIVKLFVKMEILISYLSWFYLLFVGWLVHIANIYLVGFCGNAFLFHKVETDSSAILCSAALVCFLVKQSWYPGSFNKLKFYILLMVKMFIVIFTAETSWFLCWLPLRDNFISLFNAQDLCAPEKPKSEELGDHSLIQTVVDFFLSETALKWIFAIVLGILGLFLIRHYTGARKKLRRKKSPPKARPETKSGKSSPDARHHTERMKQDQKQSGKFKQITIETFESYSKTTTKSSFKRHTIYGHT